MIASKDIINGCFFHKVCNLGNRKVINYLKKMLCTTIQLPIENIVKLGSKRTRGRNLQMNVTFYIYFMLLNIAITL
jgi:hypothetical protein